MRSLTAVALICLIAPATVLAADGRWTSGYGQGVTEATVTNGRGTTFYIACPDTALNRAPSVTLEPRGMTGGADAANVGVILTIDGRSTNWPLNRRVLDQNQVLFTADASTAAQKTALRALMRGLGQGRSLTVAIPGDGIRETFTLAGSFAALGECAVH
ncbi:hypothetical protein ACETK8_11435 [Brevundimonas staleyi]|uniref:Uncharacterized protein n=1 Tax=Brevundimonas staleyi TaxID=74326 RepID=A0ABW0FQ25_9CAUL